MPRRKKEPPVYRVVAKELRELAAGVYIKGLHYEQIGKLQAAMQRMLWHLATHKAGK